MAALLLAACGPVSMAAADGVILPYRCELKDGAPRLSPAEPSRFEIVGERQERAYTACRDGKSANCRSMMVHRFDVNCAGKKVAWARLAAQMETDRVGGSWFADGRLNLVMRPPAKPGDKNAPKRKMRFVLPPGYAPVGEVGARIAFAGTEPGTDETIEPAQATDANGETAQPPSEGVTVEPIPNAETIPALLDQSAIFDSWQTVVQTAEAAVPGQAGLTPAHEISGATTSSIFWWTASLLAGSLIAAAAWMTRHRRLGAGAGASMRAAGAALDPVLARIPVPAVNPVLERLGAAFSGVGASLRARWVSLKWRWFTAEKPWEWRNTTIANGAQSAEALFARADKAVRSLGPASVLRDTLTAELRNVRQKLDGLRGASGDVRTARLSASLRAIVRDLERIGRIADSAAASLKTDRDSVVIPNTRTEAFEVLGLNPDTPEATLKRIVDALRMGWHPDHARDEADKASREDRTKQINIAWDLIVGKRH